MQPLPESYVDLAANCHSLSIPDRPVPRNLSLANAPGVGILMTTDLQLTQRHGQQVPLDAFINRKQGKQVQPKMTFGKRLAKKYQQYLSCSLTFPFAQFASERFQKGVLFSSQGVSGWSPGTIRWPEAFCATLQSWVEDRPTYGLRHFPTCWSDIFIFFFIQCLPPILRFDQFPPWAGKDSPGEKMADRFQETKTTPWGPSALAGSLAHFFNCPPLFVPQQPGLHLRNGQRTCKARARWNAPPMLLLQIL